MEDPWDQAGKKGKGLEGAACSHQLVQGRGGFAFELTSRESTLRREGSNNSSIGC